MRPIRFFSPTMRLLACALLLATSGQQAFAQAYPNKSIKLLIPAPPGGGTDAMARVVADALTVTLKQQVVPENKPGASGIIASELLAKSANDGYTLMIVQNGHTMNPALFKKLPYDTQGDFAPVAAVGRAPLILIAATASGAKTLKDMADLGKRQPASMTFGAAEASTRIAANMIGEAIGVPVTVASYKGTGAAVVDVMGGHINFSVTTIASTLAQKSTGKINFIGVLATERSPFLPDVPTMKEQGFAGLEAGAWYGIIGPANLPKPVIDTLNAAIRTALTDPQVKQKMDTLAIVAWNAGAEELDQFIRKEIPTTQKMARKAGIEAE